MYKEVYRGQTHLENMLTTNITTAITACEVTNIIECDNGFKDFVIAAAKGAAKQYMKNLNETDVEIKDGGDTIRINNNKNQINIGKDNSVMNCHSEIHYDKSDK